MSNNIEHVFYINLERRPDRRQHMENLLQTYQLDHKAERIEAVDTPHSGIVGCSFSHLHALKLARTRGYKNILILEDDFTFLVEPSEFEYWMDQFFSKNIEYDVCMLSYIIQRFSPTEHEFVHKVLDGQTASGYLVNSQYYDTIISLYEWAFPLLQETNHHWLYANDMVWKQLQPDGKWYYLTPKIGKQLDGFSDNKQCFVKYDEENK